MKLVVVKTCSLGNGINCQCVQHLCMYRNNENVTKLGCSGGYRVLKTTQLFNLKVWILGHMNYIFSHYLG